jgi:hypothetical protein
MSWKLSRFRAGDLVEVRSKEEILAMLDERGCVDGMPFMPEMLGFCGQRLRVSAVAHKTCETALHTYKGRRLSATVHLAGTRCDGAAHGGCQADCNLFWKDLWLKPADDNGDGVPRPGDSVKMPPRGCTETTLLARTRLSSDGDGAPPCYSCQATRLYEATEPLSSWNPRQYVFDVVSGNHSLRRVLRVLFLAALRWCLHAVPVGYRITRSFNNWMHKLLTGRPMPSLCGKVGRGSKTPTGRLDLKPGELVRIKPQPEIEETLDGAGNNRGLSFDGEEMAPYCGRVFRVRRSVTQILDERTGKMVQMKQPCIMLESVVCNSEYASCRLNCPRAIRCYWREIWLERVEDHRPAPASGNDAMNAGDREASDAVANSRQRLTLPRLRSGEPAADAVEAGVNV